MWSIPPSSSNEGFRPIYMKTIEGHNVKIFIDNIEESALAQIKKLIDIDVFSDKKIRIMPDVHAGAGCVIGFTGNLGDKVIPNIVGVDIGCGMRVINIGRNDNIDFHAFNDHILSNIPSGMHYREENKGFKPLVGEEIELYREGKELLKSLYCYRDLKNQDRIKKSLGTLGNGNHFIELDRDDYGDIYIVIHTGSRNLGKQVAEIYQNKAIKHMTDGHDELEEKIKKIIEEYKASDRRKELQAVIKKIRWENKPKEPKLPKDLCYLEGQDKEDYLHDMRICQKWAVLNRKLIGKLLIKFFNDIDIKEEFETIHNYIGDDNIIRKGAISAYKGERCIIPLNMRDGALICIGKGNEDWNCSACHGAGRIMSRSQAYEKISIKEFRDSMSDIYSETINDFTRDEAPMVYKPMEEIISNIGETVEIDKIIKPIFNFKSPE